MTSELLPDRFLRPMTSAEARTLVRISMFFWLGGGGYIFLALLTRAPRLDRAALWVVVVVCLMCALWCAAMQLMPPDVLRWLMGPTMLALVLTAASVTTVGVMSAHRVMPENAAFYLQTTVIAFCVLRLRWALVTCALCAAGWGWILLSEGASYGLLRWGAVLLPALVASALVGPLPGRAASATRVAQRATEELAVVNAELESRVAEQVLEIQRASELRRFLSPEIADAVLSADHLLDPHRREIAVFFSDLRGFTAFAARVEPEEVLEALNTYYACVGAVLRRHGATLGEYAGDGIMAYLGDPLPVADPAGEMLRTAAEVRDALTPLTARWRRQGHDLGVGIGIALGHATLGVVGFDERRSYTPLGSVVNLASRLCAVALDGEVLVDQRAATAGGMDLEPHSRPVLKGFGEVAVYALPAAIPALS